MRSGTWILAIFGIVGLTLGTMGAADELGTDRDQFLPDGSNRTRTIQYYSRSGKSGTQHAPLRLPEHFGHQDRENAARDGALPYPLRFRETAGSRAAGPATTRAGQTPPVRNYYRDLFESSSRSRKIASPASSARAIPSRPQIDRLLQSNATAEAEHVESLGSGNQAIDGKSLSSESTTSAKSDVIAADYNQQQDAAARGTIRQVRVTPENVTPFQAGDEPPHPFSRKQVRAEPAPHPKKDVIPRIPRAAVVAPPQSALETMGPQTPMVSVEWIKNGDINVGQECLCELLVKNTGTVTTNDVIVDAYFPQDVRISSTEPRSTESSDHLSWKLASLEPGDEQTIHISLIPSRRGDLATTAYVRFTGAASGLFRVQEPMLKLSVEGPDEVVLGEPVPQTVIVSNPGSGVAKNVVIEAQLPEGLEHPRGDRLVMEIGAINPGETRKVRLALAAVAGGSQQIKIEALADATPKQEISADIRVIAPSIRVAIDGPSLRYVGRKSRITLTVANDGIARTNNVRVLHKIPDGYKFIRSDNGGQFDHSARIASWFVGGLDPDESRELQVELAATKLGSYVHRAGAISENGARSEAELKMKIDGAASLVLEVVDLDDPVEIGVETAYEIRVGNDGSKEATNVAVSCELPAGIELVRAKGPTPFVAENALIVFKSLPKLEPGKTAIFRIHVRGKLEGNLRFRARLASDSIREPLNFEELTKFYVD
jgi:uncharacterized repeat protein (TIGR01451 family)